MQGGGWLEEDRREDGEQDGEAEGEQVGRGPVVGAVGSDVCGKDAVEEGHREEHAGAAGERHREALRLVAQFGRRHLHHVHLRVDDDEPEHRAVHEDAAEVERRAAELHAAVEAGVADGEDGDAEHHRPLVAAEFQDERQGHHEGELADLSEVLREGEVGEARLLEVERVVVHVPLEGDHGAREQQTEGEEARVLEEGEGLETEGVHHAHRRAARLGLRGRQEEREAGGDKGRPRRAGEDPRRRVEPGDPEAADADHREHGGGHPAERAEHADVRERGRCGVRHRDRRRERPAGHVDEAREQEKREEQRGRAHEEAGREEGGVDEVREREDLLRVEEPVGEHADERRGERTEADEHPAPDGPGFAAGERLHVGYDRVEPHGQRHELQEHYGRKLDAESERHGDRLIGGFGCFSLMIGDVGHRFSLLRSFRVRSLARSLSSFISSNSRAWANCSERSTLRVPFT